MNRRIESFLWLDWVVEKIEEKHGVTPEADRRYYQYK